MSSLRLVARAVAVIVHRSRVLLVTSTQSPEAWVPPGGRLEAREGACTAAAREAVEETGVEVAIGHLLAIRQVWWPDRDVLELYYAARPVSDPAEVAGAGREGRGLRWFEVAALPTVTHFPEQLAQLCERALAGCTVPLELGAVDYTRPPR